MNRFFGNVGLVILGSIIWASHAAASHAYLRINCQSKTFSFYYTGNYPIGGTYSLFRLDNKTGEVKMIPGGEEEQQEYDEDTISSMDLFFTASDVTQTSKPPEVTKDCFTTESELYTESVTFTHVSPKAAKLLKIKEGQVESFNCNDESSVPMTSGKCKN